MAHKAVFCISSDEAQAMEIVNQLKLAGFANDDISALLPDKTGLKDFGYERHTKGPEGALAGGLGGGLFCAALGWLAWLGVLPIPGAGPLVAAGVSVATLGSAALGTLLGGIIGGFIGLARPEYEVRRYQGKLPGDNILISVHCETPRAVRWAKHLFKSAGASEIAVGTEAPGAAVRPGAIQPAAQPA
jgi:hypothetical protein